MDRNQIYLMHDAARQAEANGLDEHQAAEDFRAAAQLHAAIGDAALPEAMRLDQQLRERGDTRPARERFADIDAVMTDPAGVEPMSDAQRVCALRGEFGEEMGIAAIQQTRPGMGARQARRIYDRLQTGSPQEKHDAVRELVDFEAQESPDYAHDIRQIALSRGGRRV